MLSHPEQCEKRLLTQKDTERGSHISACAYFHATKARAFLDEVSLKRSSYKVLTGMNYIYIQIILYIYILMPQKP